MGLGGQEMTAQLTEEEKLLWQRLVEAFLQFANVSAVFFAPGVDRVKLLREGFRYGDIATTMYLASYLSVSELKLLLPELVYVATAPGYAARVRKIILSLPLDWLLANIEETCEPILYSDDEEDFRRIFELYMEIDRELASRLAERAINHADELIREVGQDFLETLSSTRGE
jgi:hypothetical protein